ncbi:MAG: GNAT family N-acetyltransferase [Deltaproteobacteria bacterium]|nr:GNAT family N-acetyltransferase [Deltaproteobacteria bacterium]
MAVAATRDGAEFLLRAWGEPDAESLAAQANNRNVWSNLRSRFPRPYTIANARTWIARVASGHERGLQFAIDIDGIAVGGIGIDVISYNAPRLGEIGYWLGEDFWGRGIASKAVPLVCAQGFEKLALARLRAVVRDSNAASLRVLEKSGFALASKLRRSDRRPRSAVVEMVYVLDRTAAAAQWPAESPAGLIA